MSTRATTKAVKKPSLNRQILAVIFVLSPLVFFSLRQSLRQDILAYIPQDVHGYTLPQVMRKSLIAQYSDLTSIRKWGCHRPESPLIFVHIGKSGGGTIRARFAAAAENYTRLKWWDYDRDNHYYPMPSANSSLVDFARGRFCSSGYINRRKPNMTRSGFKTFEGSFPCHATTPLGKFVGCPAFFKDGRGCRGCRDLNAAGCYVVYAGHNLFGNELHWLPAPYLQEWWKQNWASVFPPEAQSAVKSITPGTKDQIWCPSHTIGKGTSKKGSLNRQDRHACSKTISDTMDTLFRTSWESIAANAGMGQNYAPIYASLPVQRTVLLREPFSWLISRFFWNPAYRDAYKCDDTASAAFYNNGTFHIKGAGWGYEVMLDHLMYLCGEECINRYDMGEINLVDIERQAEANLRHSFSVVGLLNETGVFYDMVTA
jgi:hypothetical protein